MFPKFSVKKPFTVFVAVVIVAVFGGVSVYEMTPDLFPEISTPYAMVMTTYPGATAEEAEKQITDPMESQLATLNNIKNVTSYSSDNYSMVALEFTDDVNMDSASVDIRDKIDQIEGNLPENAGTPLVMKIDMNMMPVTVAAVSMKDTSSADVSDFTRENLENKLKGVTGVANVTSMGMVDDGLRVVLSQKKIDEVNGEVSAAIERQYRKGEGQIRKGISSAKSGKKKLQSAKDKISEGGSVYEQTKQSRADAVQAKNEHSDRLTRLSDLQDSYKAVASGDTDQVTYYEQAIRSVGSSAETLASDIARLQGQIKVDEGTIAALDEALASMHDMVGDSFTLSSNYADAAAVQSSVDAIVNQLQSSLSELESSKQAALDSADMN